MTIVVVALAPASMILGVMPGMFAVQGARLELRAVHGEGRSGTFTARQLKCGRTGCAWWGSHRSDDGTIEKEEAWIHGCNECELSAGDQVRARDV
ncbi:hypothetical protein [Streptosporangium sandarakinum]